MDQPFTPDVAHKTPLQVPTQPHTQIQHLRFLRSPLLPQNHSQQITWKSYCKCRRQTPFCKCISRRLLNGKAPHYEFDTFSRVKELLYKHVTDAGKKFLALVIPKSWKYTVLMEAYNKLGHQGNLHTYCLIKCQYYWKGMNKDIRKYIANCVSLLLGKNQSATISITND